MLTIKRKLLFFCRGIEMIKCLGCLRGNESRSSTLSSIWIQQLQGFLLDKYLAIKLDNLSNKSHNTNLVHAMVRERRLEQCAALHCAFNFLVHFQEIEGSFPYLADPAWPQNWWIMPLFPGNVPGRKHTYETHYC